MNQKKILLLVFLAAVVVGVIVSWAHVHGRKVEQKAMVKADETL